VPHQSQQLLATFLVGAAISHGLAQEQLYLTV